MHDTEDLWHRKNEVEDLWQEEEDHGFREVSQDTDHGKCHACKVAEGISYKDLWREFIVLQEAQSHKDEGNDDGQGENMLWNCLRGNTDVDLDNVMKKNKAGNHKALTSFNAIDTSIDVDRVCAEYSKESHIHVIK